MTKKGVKVLRFLRKYIKEHEIPPTKAEILDAIGGKSVMALDYAIKSLEESGKVKRTLGKQRNIWLVN